MVAPAVHHCCISLNSAALLSVPFSTTGFTGRAIIDSASTLNIVNVSFVTATRLTVNESTPTVIKGISSAPTRTLGTVRVTGKIRSLTVTFIAHVVPDFSHPVLLGVPFICAAPVDILASERSIAIGDQRFPFPPDFLSDTCLPVRLATAVTVPAHHDVVARVYIVTNQREVLVEQRDCPLHERLSLRTGSTLTAVVDGEALV